MSAEMREVGCCFLPCLFYLCLLLDSKVNANINVSSVFIQSSLDFIRYLP